MWVSPLGERRFDEASNNGEGNELTPTPPIPTAAAASMEDILSNSPSWPFESGFNDEDGGTRSGPDEVVAVDEIPRNDVGATPIPAGGGAPKANESGDEVVFLFLFLDVLAEVLVVEVRLSLLWVLLIVLLLPLLLLLSLFPMSIPPLALEVN